MKTKTKTKTRTKPKDKDKDKDNMKDISQLANNNISRRTEPIKTKRNTYQ